jgi:hypothetical protein
VPSDETLIGRTFYLQVVFGNGDMPAPTTVTITGQ